MLNLLDRSLIRYHSSLSRKEVLQFAKLPYFQAVSRMKFEQFWKKSRKVDVAINENRLFLREKVLRFKFFLNSQNLVSRNIILSKSIQKWTQNLIQRQKAKPPTVILCRNKLEQLLKDPSLEFETAWPCVYALNESSFANLTTALNYCDEQFIKVPIKRVHIGTRAITPVNS